MNLYKVLVRFLVSDLIFMEVFYYEYQNHNIPI